MRGLSYAAGSIPVSVVCICVDSVENELVIGRMYHCYSEEAIPFTSQVQMLLRMSELYDTIDFPQASTRGRSMRGRNAQTGKVREAKQVRDEQDVKNQIGQKASFIVRVNSRQNATWQGTVSWTDKGVTRYFRSALELLKLIDSALADSESGKKSGEEDGTADGQEN